MQYVFFKEDSNTHEEVYALRIRTGFSQVTSPDKTNLAFDTAAEAYEFARTYRQLQYWRVGTRWTV